MQSLSPAYLGDSLAEQTNHNATSSLAVDLNVEVDLVGDLRTLLQDASEIARPQPSGATFASAKKGRQSRIAATAMIARPFIPSWRQRLRESATLASFQQHPNGSRIVSQRTGGPADHQASVKWPLVERHHRAQAQAIYLSVARAVARRSVLVCVRGIWVCWDARGAAPPRDRGPHTRQLVPRALCGTH